MIKVDTPIVGFMDCDLSTDLSDFKNLAFNSASYDIVTGSRYLVSSKLKRSFGRLVISQLFNYGMRFLFKSKIRDHECGFKLWKTDVLQKLVTYTGHGPNKRDRRMFWDTEMWIYAQRLNYKILEIPVTWNAGAKSALRFKSELSMLKYIFKLWICGKWRSIK